MPQLNRQLARPCDTAERTSGMSTRRAMGSVMVAAALMALGSACAGGDELHQAAHRGDVAQVRALLRRGVDPDARDSYGGTALHAAMFQGNVEVVELLIAHGFDVNAIGPRNGYTPLHDAVWANNVAAARLLLKHGARTDIKGKDGLSAHDKAVREGRKDMAELLKGVRR